MPSKFHKVQKRVNKKKGNTTALHENSRDALRLRSAVARDDRVARLGALREKHNEPHMLRVLHFHDVIADDQEPLSDEKVHEAINSYLDRDNETLDDLRAERRPGRPPNPKQTLLEQQRATEQREYEYGFWMPDMQDANNLAKLKEWKGEWVGLGQIKFVRVEKAGRVRESAFPPKGGA
ncbi:hypothetical protein AAFC00_005874 [Neodothiora populina]|uniref:Translation machinery-associated protein 16 n=1 Tax=Neodothiora populina TaxID=2781224 RepID=A0ABR3P6G4_9PEZI